MEKSTDYFCIQEIKCNGKVIDLKRKNTTSNCIGGRYKGKTPMEAAKKVASRTFREIKGISRKTLDITITKITRGKVKKSYTYHLKKKLFEKPQGPFNSKFKIVAV